MIRILLLMTLCSILICGCKRTDMNDISSDNPNLRWHGRIYADKSGDRYLISPASYVSFRIQGEKCRVWLQNAAPQGEYNYFSVTVDGFHQKRLMIKSDSLFQFDIPIRTPGEFHDIMISKETEASCGQIIITGIEAAGLLSPTGETKKKIEFIGNSITAGMSSDESEIACGYGNWYDQSNAYDAYGPRVARELNMDYAVTAVSGIGVYRNSGSDFPVMGDIYESTFLTAHPEDPKWDFHQWQPDIVAINLGTNDFSDGGGMIQRLPFDSTNFIENFVRLVAVVHKHHPDAKIIFLQSSMSGPQYIDIHKACLDAVVQQSRSSIAGLSIDVFSFSPFNASGCSGHPGVEDHGRMAG
ncbi:MAG: GDSL-type esterase/lipase family protein, partial [Saprospiraceae bacterium]